MTHAPPATPLNAIGASAAPQCFGCGLENPEGLQIEIFRDADHTDRLVGRYRPRPSAGGFPSIVHGGALYTVLDCMAGWVPWTFRMTSALVWLTKTATMRYHRPARLDIELVLSSVVLREPTGPRDPLVIRATIRDPSGEMLCDADFDYVSIPADRFLSTLGLDEFPEGYRRHFGDR